jgi:type III restriction enzyme
MIEGIKYLRIGDREYEMRLFEENEVETYLSDLVFKVNNKDKTIYEKLIPLDSNVEMDFARDCENREDVEFYFKLPFWFKIKTPIGEYNPDWALIFTRESKVYFVAETKATDDLNKLRPEEKMKIQCGYAHFREFADVDFKHCAKVSDLR